MQTCPCGFVAPSDVRPESADWHRQHRRAHLKRYPDADAGTRESLDRMVEHAQAGAIAPRLAGVDLEAMRQMEAVLAATTAVCGNNPMLVVAALIGSIATLAANSGPAGDLYLRVALETLTKARAEMPRLQNAMAAPRSSGLPS